MRRAALLVLILVSSILASTHGFSMPGNLVGSAMQAEPTPHAGSHPSSCCADMGADSHAKRTSTCVVVCAAMLSVPTALLPVRPRQVHRREALGTLRGTAPFPSFRPPRVRDLP